MLIYTQETAFLSPQCYWAAVCPHMVSKTWTQYLTFGSESVCVEVENSSQQSHFLQDDAKTVNVSFLSPTGRRTVHPQQVRSRPQLTCTDRNLCFIYLVNTFFHKTHRRLYRNLVTWKEQHFIFLNSWYEVCVY